jgi:hypothetical protein
VAISSLDALNKMAKLTSQSLVALGDKTIPQDRQAACRIWQTLIPSKDARRIPARRVNNVLAIR